MSRSNRVKHFPDNSKIDKAVVEKAMSEKEYDYIALNVTLQEVVEIMEEKLQRYQPLLSKILVWKYIKVICKPVLDVLITKRQNKGIENFP